MRVVYIQAGCDPRWTEIDGSLKTLQTWVGGYVEKVHIPGRPDLALLVDEDGRMKPKQMNTEASMACGQEIRGHALLVGVEGSEIVSPKLGDLFPYPVH